jgi:histidyl-tRNA synthetase
VETLWHGKLGKRLEKASQKGATHALILGPDEMNSGQCVLRDMQTREEQKIPLEHFKDMEKIKSLFKVL